MSHHFGAAGVNVSFYADTDNDGLVNVLEYYADEIANRGLDLTGEALNRISIEQLGLDPNDADSDGDLLTDGFEWFFSPFLHDFLEGAWGCLVSSEDAMLGAQEASLWPREVLWRGGKVHLRFT